MDSIVFLIAYGFVALWSLAWLWAFVRVSSDELKRMMEGDATHKHLFSLQGLGWSALCALIGIIPLCFMLWSWARLQGYLPG